MPNSEPEPTSVHRLFVSRLLLASLFYVAGILHFVFPDRYAEIIPPFLPFPLALVYISGVCESFGGIGVLVPSVRRYAGYGLIALLIAVFPANIYMLYKQWQEHGWTAFTWLLVARLPLQFVMIHWVQRATR